jgi:predicted RNA binding protein YcfA (HicA-like mRNA interferase family)
MSKTKKNMLKMQNNQKDWCIEDLEKLAKKYEMMVHKRGGSHVIFDHPKCVELLSVTSKRPIKSIYIKKFLEMLDVIQKGGL